MTKSSASLMTLCSVLLVASWGHALQIQLTVTEEEKAFRAEYPELYDAYEKLKYRHVSVSIRYMGDWNDRASGFAGLREQTTELVDSEALAEAVHETYHHQPIQWDVLAVSLEFAHYGIFDSRILSISEEIFSKRLELPHTARFAISNSGIYLLVFGGQEGLNSVLKIIMEQTSGDEEKGQQWRAVKQDFIHELYYHLPEQRCIEVLEKIAQSEYLDEHLTYDAKVYLFLIEKREMSNGKVEKDMKALREKWEALQRTRPED